jgi:hypothetical protein
MIADEHEYRVTQEQIERLAAALREADQGAGDSDSRHEQLMRAGLASQLHDLRAELVEYEARRVGQQASTRR